MAVEELQAELETLVELQAEVEEDVLPLNDQHIDIILGLSRNRTLISRWWFRTLQIASQGPSTLPRLVKLGFKTSFASGPRARAAACPSKPSRSSGPMFCARTLPASICPAMSPAMRETLGRWAGLLWSPQADTLKEQELLPDFLTDIFCQILGYTRAVDNKDRYTFSREKHVEVDGKFADAVLGDLLPATQRFLVAVEGKGPKDPLDRPFAGRRMSAVDQGYRYAINLPCDWIIVTSMRQTRLYHKGSDQHTYERFDTDALAKDEAPAQAVRLPARCRAGRARRRRVPSLRAADRFGKSRPRADQGVLRPLRRHAGGRL